MFLLLGVLAVMGVNKMLDPQLLPVKKVHVDGSLNNVSADQLQLSIAPQVVEGFIRMDVSKVKDVIESLPWVQTASVRRIWPDTLKVYVEEQSPIARWGKDALVSVEGKVFRPGKNSIQMDLPVLLGPDGSSELLVDRFHRINEALMPLQLKVVRLSMDERHAWAMELENGVKIILGRDVDNSRLQRFIKAYKQLVAARGEPIASVDMRYTNGLSVKWKHKTGPVG
jgi:cell division protein FtsQ